MVAGQDSWAKKWLQDQLPKPDATRVRRTTPLQERAVSALSKFDRLIPLPRGEARGIGTPQGSVSPAGEVAAGFVPGVGELMDVRDLVGALKRRDVGGAALAGASLVLPFSLKQLGKLGVAKELEKVGRYAIISAENPGGLSASAEENARRMASLAAELRSRGYDFRPVTGRYRDPQTGEVLSENGFFIYGMPEREAKLVGARFGQNAVMSPKGYHEISSGNLFPSKGANTEPNDLPFTEFSDGTRVDLQPDFDNPVPDPIRALPVPKNASPEAMRLVDELRAGMGSGAPPIMPRVKAIPEDKGRLMANTYEQLPEVDPEAKAAYDALTGEVDQQFKAIEDAGYKIEFVDEDPYKNSQELFRDIRENRRLKVLKTNEGSDHPYMSREQNDKFRAVHDFIGHGGGGNQFGKVGEENAYRIHASTLSPLAQRALATETRGQNSWVNFGPNSHLPPAERPFAQQKAALWPESLTGDYPDMDPPSGLLGSMREPPPPVPDLPGTGEVPSGMVRRFHVTSPENVASIMRGGLRMENAQGIEGPRAIYGWDDYGKAREYAGDRQSIVEFIAPEADFARHPLATTNDVAPDRILGVHEPWHEQYRYALENNLSPEDLRATGQPDYIRAAEALEANRPKVDSPRPSLFNIGSERPQNKWQRADPYLPYDELGKDPLPVPQVDIERQTPLSPGGFSRYAEMVDQATRALNSRQNMRRVDTGLKERGDLWYFMDPVARMFMDQLGEKEGMRRFQLLMKTIASTSPNSEFGKNVDRAVALFPSMVRGIDFRGQNLNSLLGSGLGNTAHNNYASSLGRIIRGEPFLAADPLKIDGFAPNLMGNFQPVTADRWQARFAGLTKDSMTPIEYLAVEDATQAWAGKLARRGLFELPEGRAPGAPGQAVPWIGEAVAGGVLTEPLPAMGFLGRSINQEADRLGISSGEAWRKFIAGELHGAGGITPRNQRKLRGLWGVQGKY